MIVATFVMDRNTYWVNVTSDAIETVHDKLESARTDFAAQSEAACVLVWILLLLLLLFILREFGMFGKISTIWKSFVFKTRRSGCYEPSDILHSIQANPVSDVVLVKHVTKHQNPG